MKFPMKKQDTPREKPMGKEIIHSRGQTSIGTKTEEPKYFLSTLISISYFEDEKDDASEKVDGDVVAEENVESSSESSSEEETSENSSMEEVDTTSIDRQDPPLAITLAPVPTIYPDMQTTCNNGLKRLQNGRIKRSLYL